MNTQTQSLTGELVRPLPQIAIELFALDLNTCTRCTGTLANIQKAIEMIDQILEVTDVAVQVHEILVKSEDDARRHHFTTSPTVRINGRDIAFETMESQCDACTDLCGCEEGTDCRVWLYKGEEYNEAPVGLIVEAILGEVLSAPIPTGSQPVAYEDVPENLQRFFAGQTRSDSLELSSCCAPAEQAVCCEPSAKSSCCGNDNGDSCGCQ